MAAALPLWREFMASGFARWYALALVRDEPTADGCLHTLHVPGYGARVTMTVATDAQGRVVDVDATVAAPVGTLGTVDTLAADAPAALDLVTGLLHALEPDDPSVDAARVAVRAHIGLGRASTTRVDEVGTAIAEVLVGARANATADLRRGRVDVRAADGQLHVQWRSR